MASDALVNQWGPARRPRVRAWIKRTLCRYRGHVMGQLQLTWAERRSGGAWTNRSQDNAGEYCTRCGLGMVSLTIHPGEDTVFVDDIRATR